MVVATVTTVGVEGGEGARVEEHSPHSRPLPSPPTLLPSLLRPSPPLSPSGPSCCTWLACLPGRFCFLDAACAVVCFFPSRIACLGLLSALTSVSGLRESVRADSGPASSRIDPPRTPNVAAIGQNLVLTCCSTPFPARATTGWHAALRSCSPVSPPSTLTEPQRPDGPSPAPGRSLLYRTLFPSLALIPSLALFPSLASPAPPQTWWRRHRPRSLLRPPSSLSRRCSPLFRTRSDRPWWPLPAWRRRYRRAPCGGPPPPAVDPACTPQRWAAAPRHGPPPRGRTQPRKGFPLAPPRRLVPRRASPPRRLCRWCLWRRPPGHGPSPRCRRP